MPLITLFYIFLLGLLISLSMTPPISRLAVGLGILDFPERRKVHRQETPRLGGVAIFFSFLLAVLLFCDMGRLMRGFMVGAIIIFLTGLADDLRSMSPRKKFIGETLAITAAVLISGVHLESLGNPLGFGEIRLGVFTTPFTIFAILGVTNAINLLDGLDGLAAGVSTIAATAIGVLAYFTGNQELLWLTVALIGSLFGFLRYNTHPAMIFMGDGGSLFLGYCMGFFSILLIQKSDGAISEVTPLVILSLPVVDTLVVMWKRFREGKSLFHPDKTHIHHRLMGLGFGHKYTVIIVYTLSYLSAAFAVTCYWLADYWQTASLITINLLLFIFHLVLSKNWHKWKPILENNQSLRQTEAFRKCIRRTRHLRVLVKYLVMAVILLSSVSAPSLPHDTTLVAIALLAISLLLIFMTNNWGNRFLHFILYFDGAFLIYQTVNYGRDTEVAGVPLILVSHVLFIILLAACGVKIFLRRRTGQILDTPLEFMILFIVVSVPLMPDLFVSKYHLLTVTGKSVILFTGYKLILMRMAQRNRKIIMATLLALLAVSLKGIIAL